MDFRTHRIAGICTGLAVSSLVLPTPYTPATLGMYGLITVSSAAGSYLPDIDEPKSKVGQIFKPISMLVKGIAGHRGIFHTPLMAILLLIALVVAKNKFIDFAFMQYFEYFLLGVISGFLSHLFVDSLTVQGIPWLWPLFQTKFSIAPLHTSNKLHQLLVRLSFVVVAIIIVYTMRKDAFIQMFTAFF